MPPSGHLFQGHARRTSAQRRQQSAVQGALLTIGLVAVVGCDPTVAPDFCTCGCSEGILIAIWVQLEFLQCPRPIWLDSVLRCILVNTERNANTFSSHAHHDPRQISCVTSSREAESFCLQDTVHIVALTPERSTQPDRHLQVKMLAVLYIQRHSPLPGHGFQILIVNPCIYGNAFSHTIDHTRRFPS